MIWPQLVTWDVYFAPESLNIPAIGKLSLYTQHHKDLINSSVGLCQIWKGDYNLIADADAD